MKKAVLVIAAALLAGMIAFCAMRWHTHEGRNNGHDGGDIALDTMPGLEWLKNYLKLSDEQFSKVCELHAAYRPKCAEMCQRISEAHDRIEKIAEANSSITPEFSTALKEHAAIHVECQEQMLKHLYETAATMRKDQGERYLNTMLPFAVEFSHSETGNQHVR